FSSCHITSLTNKGISLLFKPFCDSKIVRAIPVFHFSLFFFKQKTAYDIGLGIPAEPLFRSSIKLIQASAVLDLTEDDFDFLTSNKVWIATDRSRARRCVEACVYGTLDFVGYPRFPAPVEFIAAVIAYYVHPVNIQTAC